MKIIELFDNKVDEGVKDIVKGIGKAAVGAAKLGNEFVKGAGGPDVLGTIDSFLDHNNDLYKKYLSKYSTRSIDRNKPIDEQFDNVMKTMYGSNITESIKRQWADAINNGDIRQIQTLIDEANNSDPSLFQDGVKDESTGKLKETTANVVRDLADMGSWAKKQGTPFNLMGISKNEKPDDSEEKSSTEEPANSEEEVTL